jgi:transposase-like protein
VFKVKEIKPAERKANVLRKDKPRTPSRKKIITGQIKAKIAIEALKGIKTVDEIAQDFNVLPSQVTHWKNVLLKQAPKLFEIDTRPIRASCPKCLDTESR